MLLMSVTLPKRNTERQLVPSYGEVWARRNVVGHYGEPTGVRAAIRVDWLLWWPARAVPCPLRVRSWACAAGLPPAPIERCALGRFSHPLRIAPAAAAPAPPAGNDGATRSQPYLPPRRGRWKTRAADRRRRVGRRYGAMARSLWSRLVELRPI